MDLQHIAKDVPDYDAYLTVDEMYSSTKKLKEEYPELVSVEIVGNTSQGDPIELINIGNGPLHAYWYGAPDPDETIGCMLIEYLTRRLCEDEALRNELGYTWHFIKAIESDWLRLNEGWLKGPFTPMHYTRHLHRPWISERAEWTVPFEYKDFKFDKPLPETEAHMHVIDKYQPDFLFRLHNSKFGGVWYAISEICEPLYNSFHTIPGWFDIPLELGQTENAKSDEVAPAIYYSQETFEDWYDRLEKEGKNPADMRNYGISPGDYAKRKYGAFNLVSELPYWKARHIADQTPTDENYRELILDRLGTEEDLEEWIAVVLTSLNDDLHQKTTTLTFLKAAAEGQRIGRAQRRELVKTDQSFDRPATQAEVFGNRVTRSFKLGAQAAMLMRIIENEIENGNSHPDLPPIRDEALEHLEQWGNSIENGLITVPIRDLVGLQLCVGLATAEYLRDNEKAKK
jgi:hypothetical protein